MEHEEFFSREAAAGYARDVLEKAVVTLVGAGALGTNVAQCLALCGVGELRVVDPDVVEPSNLTRSPLFDRRRLTGNRRRWKAKELASAFLATSYARNPVARYATRKVQPLGLGIFSGTNIVIAAVDSLGVRAYLAEATRLMAVPLVEAGFSYPRGQITVFPNQDADDSCWRCLHPDVPEEGFSCATYARAAVSRGMIPATQSVAAVFGGLVAEATLASLHSDFPLAGKSFHLDIRTGRSSVMEISRDPDCAGAHERYDEVRPIDVGANHTARRLLAACRVFATEPVLHLPTGFVVQAPCTQCGAPVQLGLPDRDIETAPTCRECTNIPRISVIPPIVVRTVRESNPLAESSLRRLGFAPGDIVRVHDATSGSTHAVRLEGGLDDLYRTVRRAGDCANTMPPLASGHTDSSEPDVPASKAMAVADDRTSVTDGAGLTSETTIG